MDIRGEMLLGRIFFLSIIVIIVLSSLVGCVEAVSTGWMLTFGVTGGDEWCYSLISTSDGGYALTGYTNPGGTRFLLVKVDQFGYVEWNQMYKRVGGGGEVGKAVVEASDGGYAIAGRTGGDCWLVKTDELGNMEWNKTYGGMSSEDVTSIVKTSDEGYVIAGWTYSFGAGMSDFWLVKTDADGNIQWNRTYGGKYWDEAYSLVATSDGGYALAGTTYSFGAGNADFWLVKTDPLGNMEWNRTYGGPYYDKAFSLDATFDGGYVVAGFANSISDSMSGDVCVVKTNASGVMEWNQTYGGVWGDPRDTCSVVATSDGGYAIAYNKYGATGVDSCLIKANASGVMEWNQTYDNAEEDQVNSVVETSDGGYALGGRTYTHEKVNGFWLMNDFWLIKTDEYGIVPEYSSWVIPSLLLATTVLVVIYKKRTFRLRPKG